MADNLRVALRADYSDQTDYSDPEWTTDAWDADALTPDESATHSLPVPTTPGTTLDTGHMTTITFLAVQNTGANDIEVDWTDNNASVHNQKVPAGRTMVIPDVDPSADVKLMATTIASTAKVAIAGT